MMKKKIWVGGCGFFVSSIISGRLSGHLGPLHLALGPSRWMVVLRWSFYWKLGENWVFSYFGWPAGVFGSKVMILYLINPLLIYIINLFILDHNFWTRNARKLIKGSKGSDSSLVSNENFSEILWSSGWALGQVTWAKLAKNLPHLWRHRQRTQNQKNDFHCKLKDLPNLLRVWTAP